MHRTATLPALPTAICQNGSCREALTPVDCCTCPCGGEGHGVPFRAGRRAAEQRILDDIAATGDVFGGAANACLTEDDDLLPPRNPRLAAVRTSTRTIDPDEYF